MNMQSTLSLVERRLVYGCGFPRFRSVDGKTDAECVFPRSRSGIYVLAYKDGGYYVGLSIDAAQRFKQHVASKRPITAITFRPVHRARQGITESETISILADMGVKVANTEKMQPEEISETGERTISAKDLERWLTDDTWNDLTGKISQSKRPHGDIEERYRGELLHKPYAQDLLDFYAEYVKRCIIKPFQTAPDKWNVTCLPSKSYEVGKCISTLNVGSQAAVLIAEKHGSISVNFSVKKSVFRRVHPNGIARLKLLAPSIKEKTTHMVALGDDQLDMSVPLSEAKAMLKDNGLGCAIRALVVHNRGMNQSGSSMYKRFHCYSFARDILTRCR